MYRRNFLAIAAAAAPCLLAADSSKLNGRWDITVPNEPRRRAWWLEIKGAETGSPMGSFIGAPGGDLNRIEDLKVQNGEATWSFSRPARNNNKAWKGNYRARLEGDRLVGTLQVEGGETIPFHGARAPKFRKDDSAKMKRGAPVELFNGRDLSGWKPVREGVPNLWKVEDGILKNAPGTTDIMTERNFMDFHLHAEYKVGPHSNSGIGLRGRYEVQILEDHGKPADTHGHGALYSRILPTANASKPAGEWQEMNITLAGNMVTVVLNGVKVIDNKEVEGLTAMAISPNEAEPGPIVIQGDHGAVEFRKLTLTPLQRS